MAATPSQIVEGVTGVVQAAQSGWDVGSAGNGYEGFTNLVNLAGTIAGTAPLGVGLNGASAALGTVTAVSKWTSGQLQPSDVMQVTGSVLGTVLAIAAVSGAPITLPALAIAAGGGDRGRPWRQRLVQ
jgi:hypothetical protein